MAHASTSTDTGTGTGTDTGQEHASRSPGASMALDPVSPNSFGEIIDADRETRDEGARPQPFSPDTRKRDQLSRATWVMIVIAGIVLGVAMTMIAAS